MTILATNQVDHRFAVLPESLIWSDRVTSTGVRICSLVLAAKSDHSAYGKGIRWPTFTVPKLADLLHTSARTVERETARLKKAGFIRSTKTKGGNQYEYLAPTFPDDTYRGRADKISTTAKTYVSWSVIAADLMDEPFHLLLMLESMGKGYKSTGPSQELLASFFQSRKKGRDNVTARTIYNWAADLVGTGLIEIDRPDPWAQNWYRLHKEMVAKPARQHGAASMLALPGTATAVAEKHAEQARQRAEARHIAADSSTDQLLAPIQAAPGSPRGVPDPDTGMGLALHFAGHFKGSADPVNATALARVLNRWKRDGSLTADDIRYMIDVYASDGFWRHREKAPWIDFQHKRGELMEQLRKHRLVEAARPETFTTADGEFDFEAWKAASSRWGSRGSMWRPEQPVDEHADGNSDAEAWAGSLN